MRRSKDSSTAPAAVLWAGVPLWLLAAVDGASPYGVAVLLAALGSAATLVVTAVLVVRGVDVRGDRGGVRQSRPRAWSGRAVLLALVAHAAAIASVPVGAAVQAEREQRRTDALVAAVTSDVEACAAAAVADYPLQGEVASSELAQPPELLARARTAALIERAVTCLRSRRPDAGACPASSAVCSLVVPGRSHGRGALTLSLAPALLDAHRQRGERAGAAGLAPPAAVDLRAYRSDGASVRVRR